MSPPDPILSNLPADEPPYLMGVLNVTPDSFYDGGHHEETEAAIRHGNRLFERGADVVDVGGESTRPGSEPTTTGEEVRRVVPVIQGLRRNHPDRVISIDTSKSEVAEAALEAGAQWVNDVTALRGDPDLVDLVAEAGAGLVLTHMQGSPDTMQDDPTYQDVVIEVRDFLEERAQHAASRGVAYSNMVLDPGIGFGKSLEHNRRLLMNVHRLRRSGLPLMVGHSRKSFLGGVMGWPADERLRGTLQVSRELIEQGVSMLRVHDVAEHVELRQLHYWLRGTVTLGSAETSGAAGT